jgi:hypothetical protein
MATSALTGTSGIVALAAAAVALAALIWCALLTRSLRRLGRTQRVVLGDGSERDLIAHGASLQDAFAALHEQIGEFGERMDLRLADAEETLQSTIRHRALVRYDAYNELSGQQSVSIALLDDRASGVVLTCIHHRDQARVYAKQIHEGRSELPLSPEEEQALEQAQPDRAHRAGRDATLLPSGAGTAAHGVAIAPLDGESARSRQAGDAHPRGPDR